MLRAQCSSVISRDVDSIGPPDPMSVFLFRGNKSGRAGVFMGVCNSRASGIAIRGRLDLRRTLLYRRLVQALAVWKGDGSPAREERARGVEDSARIKKGSDTL